MSFVDKADVEIKAGTGGNGCISFRKEKFIDHGGPDGGDGGRGGDVIFEANNNEDTLANFRYLRELAAKNGESGAHRRQHGKNGSDLVVAVPTGTIILGDGGKVLADLSSDHSRAVIAKGGDGGFGNAHFVSSVRQAPKMAEKGEPGEKLRVTLELKLIADVGLVGLPNAGKSTFLSVVSSARPEIADYPFTTLTPNLGVSDLSGGPSLLIADIPGLIEGAAEGKGLGDEFLKHIERTLVIIHIIDAYNDDVAKAYKTIEAELKAYSSDLTTRPQVIALNKTEGLDTDIIEDLIKQIKTVAPKSSKVMPISAKSLAGIKTLLEQVGSMVMNAKKTLDNYANETIDQIPVLTLTDTGEAFNVEKRGDGGSYLVTGKKIEKFAVRTSPGSEQGIRRLKDIMKKMGITHELARQGAVAGSIIDIGGIIKFGL